MRVCDYCVSVWKCVLECVGCEGVQECMCGFVRVCVRVGECVRM